MKYGFLHAGSVVRRLRALMLSAFACAGAVTSVWAQDPLQEANAWVKQETGKRAFFSLEERVRFEEKFGVNFGKSVNQRDVLTRLRIGFGYSPTSWLSFYGMGQDTRAFDYPGVVPNTIRDTMDLHEAWVKLFDQRDSGFGAAFGRAMLDYGESRLIGTPQWSNVSRTFDHGRLYYRTPRMRLEALLVSPVKILPDAYNRPDLGERIWGTYDTFSHLFHGAGIDAYALRHSQNQVGGWVGAGTLGTNTFGGRLYGPISHGFAYSLEAAGQTGHLGLVTQRAYAWFAGASEKTTLFGRPLFLSGEYKVASGTASGSGTSGTFDQLSPANHDKFGHEDLFGWRNLKTLKSLETWSVTKALAINLMYTDEWLYSAADSLYNSQGGSIALSKKGTAGTGVGQELDGFLTVKHGAHTFGAGMGHFFRGEFIVNTLPRVNPRYFYFFQQYNFR